MERTNDLMVVGIGEDEDMPPREGTESEGSGQDMHLLAPDPDDDQRATLQGFGSVSVDNGSTNRRIYISHALSTWNLRLFEFAAVLFLSTIYPQTLLPASVYALVRAGSAIIFARVIGRTIDSKDRLSVLRIAIGRSLISFS